MSDGEEKTEKLKDITIGMDKRGRWSVAGGQDVVADMSRARKQKPGKTVDEYIVEKVREGEKE